MLRKKYEKFFFCGLPGEIFFDTRSDENKRFFFLGLMLKYCKKYRTDQLKSLFVKKPLFVRLRFMMSTL